MMTMIRCGMHDDHDQVDDNHDDHVVALLLLES